MLSKWHEANFGKIHLECFHSPVGAKLDTEKSSRNNNQGQLCHPVAVFELSSSYCVTDSDAILTLIEIHPTV